MALMELNEEMADNIDHKIIAKCTAQLSSTQSTDQCCPSLIT